MESNEILSGLIGWIGRAPWAPAFAEVYARHVGPVCEAAEIEIDQLAALIGEEPALNIWGCAFEDFIASELDDGRNVVEEYLRRRGGKEADATREHLLAMRGSTIGLYAVTDVARGEAVGLRDLVRDSLPIRLDDLEASHSLRKGDRIAARLLRIGGRTILGASVLLFDEDSGEIALSMLRELTEAVRLETAQAVDEETVLAGGAYIFTQLWLSEALADVIDPQESMLTNDDGEEVELVEVTFPRRTRASDARLRTALAQLDGLRPDGSGNSWQWLRGEADGPPSALQEDEESVLGTVELTPDSLLLRTSSRARGERGRAMLERVLSSLVGEPMVRVVSFADTFDEDVDEDDEEAEVDQDDLAAKIRLTMDQAYGRMLEEPHPDLDDAIPLELARTAKGRDRLVKMMTRIDQAIAKYEPESELHGYDTAWIWEKLGIAARRPARD